MPRPLRIEYPGAVYHVISSGALKYAPPFKTFKWFDGLTMSGPISNRFAPFKP